MMRGVLPVVIAIATGILVLAGYFIPLPFLAGLRQYILNTAVILTAFALFVGVFNLLIVHWNKVHLKQKGMAYSVILIVSMVATFLLGLVLGPQNKWVSIIFNNVQLPVEASLLALLAVTLTYASIRLLRKRLNLLSIVFIVTGLLMLVGTAPLPFLGDLFVINGVPLFSGLLRPLIAQVLAAGGARGILLGVALGTLTTGLRVLFGADRPYGGK
jgi:hypothetical protein